MKVWLVIHDDREYDMGDTYVCGVYSTEKAANESVVSRTPSGRRSTSFGAHNEDCCGVTEFEVLTEPMPFVRP
jgi:hypothetical protein